MTIPKSRPLKRAVVRAFASLAAPPVLSTAEYSEKNIVLPSLCAEPGPWRNDRAPFQVGIMDALDDPALESVAVKKSSQCGVSQLACNWTAKHIELDPCPILIVQPTEDDGREFLLDKLKPVVDASPSLRRLVVKAKRGETGTSSARQLMFPGGWVRIGSAKSPASLSSKSARHVISAEVDRHPISAGVEGTPDKLADARMRTFWNSKALYLSTPTEEGRSRIDDLYEAGDRRRYIVTCSDCHEEQPLVWPQVRWPKGDPWSAVYACRNCGAEWDDIERWRLLKTGRWVAQSPGGRRASFHVTSMMSPWTTLGKMASDFLEAKKNPHTLRVWINHELGECWKPEVGDCIDGGPLLARREDYGGPELPEGVCLLTASVDVQKDRLEFEVCGWGLEEECWGIEHTVLLGDPTSKHPWEALDTHRQRIWVTTTGVRLRVARWGIDSGNWTENVYRYVEARRTQGVVAIKGAGGQGKPLVSRAKAKGHPGVLLLEAGTDTAKDIAAHRWAVGEGKPGYWHLPGSYSDEYIRQYTAEERNKKGQWTKRVEGSANEALDLRVYNMVVFASLGVDMISIAKAVSRGTIPEGPRRSRPMRVLNRGIGR